MYKMTFICQAVDENDPNLAVSVDWIREFSYHPEVERIMVIALRAGEFSLPDNITVKTIKGSNHLMTIINFYKEVFKNLKKTDFYFIHLGGPYSTFLIPFKIFLRKKVYQWYTHSHINSLMKFQALFCIDRIFTATPSSFAMNLDKVRVIGHGIDENLFRINSVEKNADLITIGRYSPVKNLDKILRLIHVYRKTFKKDLITNFYGPLEASQEFKTNLNNYRDKLELEKNVSIRGPVNRDVVPSLLNQHKVFISFSETGLDKASLEAMACGLPVLTSNRCVAEILPDHLRALLIVNKDDLEDQVSKLNRLLTLSDQERLSLGEELRAIVKRGHTTTLLVNKIFVEINNHEK